VREVVIMGGNAFCAGNITPAAEANIYHDVEAADIVFGAEWPVTMVGLDVTQKTIMTAEQLGRFNESSKPTTRHLSSIIPFYLNFTRMVNKLDGIYLHDPTTIAYLLAPHAFQTQKSWIRVESESFSRGKTWPASYMNKWSSAWLNRPWVNVCVDIDGSRISDLILERLL